MRYGKPAIADRLDGDEGGGAASASCSRRSIRNIARRRPRPRTMRRSPHLRDDALAAGDAHAAALSRRSRLYRRAEGRSSRRRSAALDFVPDALLASFHGMPRADAASWAIPITASARRPRGCWPRRWAARAGRSPSSRASAAPNGSSPRPTRRWPRCRREGVTRARDRRARLFRRLPGDAGGAGDPRARDLPRGGRQRISPICPASTTARAGMAMLRTLVGARTCRLGAARAKPSAISTMRRGCMARVAIVTGGTRGIGEAISLALQDAGHDRRRQLCRQ